MFAVLGLTLAPTVCGCGDDTNPPECEFHRDCRDGERCVEGVCEEDVFGFDAGTDSGQPDAGLPDAGPLDSGQLDASWPDAGPDDSGPADSGLADSGPYDAGSPDGGRPDTGPGQCTPQRCSATGIQCGDTDDGCGGTLRCGACEGPRQICDSQNKCVCPDPVECDDVGAQCGMIDTGCGWERHCGQCSGSREVCTSDNRCACGRRLECSSSGIQCGDADDGCGGTLRCGRCAGPRQSCNSHNRCVCPDPIRCSDVGAQCGTIDTGCGWRDDCGGCSGPSVCRNNRCTCTVRDTDWRRFRNAGQIGDTGANAPWMHWDRATQFDGVGSNAYFRAPRGACGSNVASYRSTLLRLYNADIDIPLDARIVGIQIRMTAKTDGLNPTMRTLHLWGARAGSPPYVSRPDERSGTRVLRSDFTGILFGGTRDTWGIPAHILTPAWVNHEWFGMRVGFDIDLPCDTPSDANPQVDAAEIRVFYERCR